MKWPSKSSLKIFSRIKNSKHLRFSLHVSDCSPTALLLPDFYLFFLLFCHLPIVNVSRPIVYYRGSHIHEALPITSGERWNLIIWTRSSSLRQNKCPMCQSVPDLVPAPNGTYGDGFLLPSDHSIL